MGVPGWAVSLAFFPGIIAHELSHVLICRLLRVQIVEVCYLDLDTAGGWVRHARPREAWKTVVIGMAPFGGNALMGSLVGAAGVALMGFAEVIGGLVLWVGGSAIIHSFPSRADFAGTVQALRDPGTPLWLRVLSYPGLGLIWAGARASTLHVYVGMFYAAVLIALGCWALGVGA